jgi:hypothetical protein
MCSPLSGKALTMYKLNGVNFETMRLRMRSGTVERISTLSILV